MKIAIDARAFNWAGIGCYTRNLLSHLAALDQQNEYIVLLNRRDAVSFEGSKFSSRFHVSVVEGSYYSWREQTIFLRQLAGIKADLFHFTHFNVPILFRRPYVVTIHDTTRFVFPGQKRQDLKQQLAYEYVFKNAVERARALVTVSNATRQELLALPFKIKAPVRTIYEGIAPEFFEAAPRELRQKARMFIGTNSPYLLFVGVWMSHKNLERLARAFKLLKVKRPELQLVITGKPKPGYASLIHTVRQLKLERDVIFPGFVPAKLLPALYQEAACFVFPSLYEGFGLPALEAAAGGTPVVASNVTSMPELLGDAAYYVNPEDEVDIAAGIERVLSDQNLRQRFIAKGPALAAKFSWQNAAWGHLEVYQSTGIPA